MSFFNITFHRLAYRLCLTTLLSLIIIPPLNASTQSTLKQCQSIRNHIHHLEEKRRDGGTAAQMNQWKRREHKYNDQYAKYNCKRYRNRLTRP